MSIQVPVDVVAERRRCGLRLSSLILIALFLPPAAEAATVYCGPGTRVESENGGGVGRIEEIGTESPHVGWYRVSFSWSPRGEWYDPSTWKLFPTGTKNVCSPKSPAADRPLLDLPPGPATPGRAPNRPTTPPTRPNDDDDDEPSVAPAPRPRPTSAPPARGGGSLPPGRYTCSMPGAGQFPINIVDGSTYSDRAGKSGQYSVNGDQITFASGSLRGQFSRILGPGKFGLSSDSNRNFYGVCNLKR